MLIAKVLSNRLKSKKSRWSDAIGFHSGEIHHWELCYCSRDGSMCSQTQEAYYCAQTWLPKSIWNHPLGSSSTLLACLVSWKMDLVDPPPTCLLPSPDSDQRTYGRKVLYTTGCWTGKSIVPIHFQPCHWCFTANDPKGIWLWLPYSPTVTGGTSICFIIRGWHSVGSPWICWTSFIC